MLSKLKAEITKVKGVNSANTEKVSHEKLVNVDVVESMRKIAVQEMNRKDREIDGLNEQLEEDSRVLGHLQVQLLDERSKRADVERPNAMLQNQSISMISYSLMLDNSLQVAWFKHEMIRGYKVLMQQVPNQHPEAATLHHKCYYLNRPTLLTQLCCKSDIFSLMRKETRAGLASSMEVMDRAPFAEVVDFCEGKRGDHILYDFTVGTWKNRFSERGKEPYLTLPGDLLILVDGKPESVSDLQHMGRTWNLLLVKSVG
ncbi:hypothetical protein CTI12_AA426780 [Artemisia annua]|uniref:DUF6469 domain-containing protein n=1 Tax=Artemisia annua TaxID=35608 RepID=A0A2U1M3D0_ARTAN|nr:hypothetical protein CTI12_AA426780 [Artemisia annua]